VGRPGPGSRHERIAGPARATVTSVAAVGDELTAAALDGAWAVGGLGLVAIASLVCVPAPVQKVFE
jgi:hypothetical protein